MFHAIIYGDGSRMTILKKQSSLLDLSVDRLFWNLTDYIRESRERPFITGRGLGILDRSYRTNVFHFKVHFQVSWLFETLLIGRVERKKEGQLVACSSKNLERN